MPLLDLRTIADRERAARKPRRLLCCQAAGCLSAGGLEVRRSLESAVTSEGLVDQVEVVGVGCLRLCGEGPLVASQPSGDIFARVTPDKAHRILADDATLPRLDAAMPFLASQKPVVTENLGRIDPERIESAIEAGGYDALAHALIQMTPGAVVEAVTHSGLRGRGGAGYPTGVKWGIVAKNAAPTKYVICNADEGDPGAFKDRTLIESDPHRVIEGMAIAGFAVGAHQGYVYLRGEHPLTTERLTTAIEQARRLGVLGSRTLGHSFAFDVEIRVGGGAYVCGEETALIASVEGKRGQPRPRPPYPGESGLWGCPTLINNVETFATVPAIIRHGAEWYASIGTPSSRGTKVFSVAGQVKFAGIVEVPMGTPLRTLVETIAGGPPDGTRVKAVQTGGPAGGFVPAHLMDTPVDYDAMAAIGSIMGSGGMVVLDESADMVDIARFFMDFCRDESCGKCVPCRVGTVQMHSLLERIGRGDATGRDLPLLESLADMVKHTSLCGLGKAAPNPVQSSLKHFRAEYEARIGANTPPQGNG